MKKSTFLTVVLATVTCLCGAAAAAPAKAPPKHAAGIEQIETVVVIYAENRSFDNLYGFFPSANGLRHVTRTASAQRDRDGSIMKELPPVWGGLTAKGVTPPVTEAQTQHLANQPFAIDDPKGFNVPLDVITRNLWHLFYQNQMQIDGGKNDKFVAYTDSGSLVMGHYNANANTLPLWKIARRYTRRQFLHGGFGGPTNHLLPAHARPISQCRPEPGKEPDRHCGARWHEPEARR
jgi:phospholipase C